MGGGFRGSGSRNMNGGSFNNNNNNNPRNGFDRGPINSFKSNNSPPSRVNGRPRGGLGGSAGRGGNRGAGIREYNCNILGSRKLLQLIFEMSGS